MGKSICKLFVGNIIIIRQELTYKIVREGTAFTYNKEDYKLLDALQDFCEETSVDFNIFRVAHLRRILNKFKVNVI